MKPFKWFWSVCMLFFISNAFAQTKSINVEAGISFELAEYRKSVIRNVAYDLSFSVPPDMKDPIPATEVLSFELKNAALPLQLDFKVKEDFLQEVIVNGKKVSPGFYNEHIVLDPQSLRTGKNTIRFQFRAGELSLNRKEEFLYTLLVPDRARTLFPCFDQPDIKAKFRLRLSVPQDWIALGNAEIQQVNDSGQLKVFQFKDSDIFSTYLFSFVAGKFSTATKKPGAHPVHFYYRETDSNKIRLSVDSIALLHKKAIDFLENYTQLRFPFQKLDFAAIPDFQYGGMEHVGAIDYKASTLFLDSGATKDQYESRGSVIAHETSHMWFGDLVTMRWFNDVWMKEVFANFMAEKITQENRPGQAYVLKFLLTNYPRAYRVDRTAGANPIRQRLLNLDQAGSLYGNIIYYKAPAMMRQLELLMGADALRDGLREYLKKFSQSNATWPDLIEILDKRTPVDLVAWNQVWVNTPGRPVIDYRIEQKDGVITRFIISQKGERSPGYILPQSFRVAMMYPDRVEKLDVKLNSAEVELPQATGKKMPSFIVFNSSGEGYGLFPVDSNLSKLPLLTDPVMKASAYINLYENMLSGTLVSPSMLIDFYLTALKYEKDELTINLLTNYITETYWKFLSASAREKKASEVEMKLWKLMQNETEKGKKKTYFRAFQNVALTRPAADSLYQIWKQQNPPAGVKLSEDEYISLAMALALREYPDETILDSQLVRTTDRDRKQKLQFLMPALSKDVNVRDSFFLSLKDITVRKNEGWVEDGLAYLHHPLRTPVSIKYLPQSLDLLEEIQKTNDIFFPANWLNASLGSYQSKEAADIVRKFLQDHPNYNPQLKMKILQAADPLFRAERLVGQ